MSHFERGESLLENPTQLSDAAHIASMSPQSSAGLLSRAMSELHAIEDNVKSKTMNEIKEELSFLNLSDDLAASPEPKMARRATISPSGAQIHETEIDAYSEDSESGDQQFGLNDSGEEWFFKARMLHGKRLRMVETVREGGEELRSHVDYLGMKANLRVKEISANLEKQEKRMSLIKAAFRTAVDEELNQIFTAGWSKIGDLGTVDIESFLRPFLGSQNQVPIGVLGPADKVPFQVKDNVLPMDLRPPKTPRFRAQKIGYPHFLCPPCTTLEKVKKSSQRDPKQIGTDSALKEFESSSDSTITIDNSSSSNELFDEQTTLNKMVNQINTLIPQQTIERKNINTFLTIEPTGILAPGPDQMQETEAVETSSISSVDRDQIEDTIQSIPRPNFLGIPLDSQLGSFLKYAIEPTNQYKSKVRKRLERYFREEKQFRRRCIGILPGGLSLFGLKPPPEPVYSSNKILKPQSTLSSEEIISDILSELGSEISEDDDLRNLFEERHGKTVTFGDSIEMKLQRDTSAEIFTTSFPIGVPVRKPEILLELQRNADLPNKSSRNISWQDHQQEKGISSSNRYLNCCPDLGSKFNCYGDYVEFLDDNNNSFPISSANLKYTSSRVTEFWQLSEDQGAHIWIFRGRIIAPL